MYVYEAAQQLRHHRDKKEVEEKSKKKTRNGKVTIFSFLYHR